MSSPPTTPPSEAPRSETCRFHEMVDPCEWAEDYRSGGFHPVRIGDTFKDGQYHVLRKLGHGSYSTVWLARDYQFVSHDVLPSSRDAQLIDTLIRHSRYVAMKVAMSKQSSPVDTELNICQHLEKESQKDSLSKHVLMPLDSFNHSGPNGTHRCLIYEPMASTTASLVEKLPEKLSAVENIPDSVGHRRYPKKMAQKILKHALSGIAFLHSNGIVHGDLQPGNLLCSARDISKIEEAEFRQTSFSEPLRRRDGKTDKWAPERLALSQSLSDFADLGPEMNIKLSDFGASFWATAPPEKTVTPVGLRAPELIFNEPFGSPIDIWSFGCLIYEFLTGTQLFSVVMMGLDEQEEVDDDHFLDLNDVIEPLPDSWLEKWPRASKWFGPNRERLNPNPEMPDDELHDSGEEGHEKDDNANGPSENIDLDIDQMPAEGKHEQDGVIAEDTQAEDDPTIDTGIALDSDDPMEEGPWINEPLEALFSKNKPKDIDEEEAKIITDLIRKVLKYDPSERPTAVELLQHPWFKT